MIEPVRRRPPPAWWLLVFAVLVFLGATVGVVRLQRRADAFRQTALALLRALDRADQSRAQQQRYMEQGRLAPKDRRLWDQGARRDAADMEAIRRRDPEGRALARIGQIFLVYRQQENKEEQALTAWQVRSARGIDAARTQPAWQNYRLSVDDAVSEYDHRAAASHRTTEAVTAFAFLASLVCLWAGFRRFAHDRYAAAYLDHENGILRRHEKRFHALVHNTSEVMAILSEDATALYLSPAARRMWGYSPEAIIGKCLFDFIADEERPRFQDTFQQTQARAGTDFTVEATVCHQSGSRVCCQVGMVNLMAEPGVYGVVVTFRDITPLKQGEEALRQSKASLEARVVERTAALAKANADLQAEVGERRALEEERERLLADALERADHDPLTGLLNHRAFHKRFQEETDRALRQNMPLAIAVLDLDNFKFFNDAYGHLVGDDVLRQVAGLLQSCCRSYDTLARFGGDEFALLMPGTGQVETARMAERLRLRLAEAAYQPPDSDSAIPLSLSMGFSVFPDEEPSRLEALELADSRLLRVKTGAEETAEADILRRSLNDSVEGFSMLDALVTAVNNKDRYTRRHSEDVMVYSLQIAREMGLDAAAQGTLATAALLHDVGKIGVPDFVLRKPSGLTDEEIEVIKHHPVMGAVIVAAVPGLEETLDAVRHHHERWDGKGYPGGLQRLEIPFAARLMAVADAFSAMTTDRPYRKGHSASKALGFLAEGAGTQWDPDCVEAFLSAHRKIDEASPCAPVVGTSSPTLAHA